MTRTRVFAALLMAPLAIAGVLLLPTPWLVALAAIVFLAALWEWFRLSEIGDTLQRTLLLLANLLLMAALVWASPTDSGGSLVLFKLVSMIGVAWWLVAMLWLRHFHFASDHDTHARVFKLAAGTLAVVPAWCALAVLHAGDPAPTGLRLVPQGHVWLLTALMIVWASLAQVDEVTRGMGKVIPSSKAQLVQPAEPAVVAEILVRGGQSVKKGQLLVRLDDAQASSELGQLQTENARLAVRAPATRRTRSWRVRSRCSGRCAPHSDGSWRRRRRRCPPRRPRHIVARAQAQSRRGS